MPIDLRQMFNQALRDERKILRPRFFDAQQAEPAELVGEETYLRLRLTRMFLKHRRELFQTKYPVVHALMRFAGSDRIAEVNVIARPELPGDGNESRLDDVVSLDQTLLGPVLYRGGDLDLVVGLYAAPADDWAQRFISLAEGVSQLAVSAPLTAAISMANTVKSSIESVLDSDGLDLKLGLDKELQEGTWLAPGYLVMIAAPDEQVDTTGLTVEGGELFRNGRIYDEHDYIVLAIEVTSSRSDWQSLGYGVQWQKLLETAAKADDIQAVKDAYLTFSSAILSSPDLSWSDRSAITQQAQKRVKAIREARDVDFLEGVKGVPLALDEMESLTDPNTPLPLEEPVAASPAELLQTDWIEGA